MNKLEELKAQRKALDAEIERLEKSERWKPNELQDYFTVEDFVSESSWRDDDIDKERYATFNVFKIKEEAKAIDRYQRVFRQLHDFAKRFNGKFNNDEYYFIISGIDKNAVIESSNLGYSSSDVKFSSEEIAEQAKESIDKEDLLFYLNFNSSDYAG